MSLFDEAEMLVERLATRRQRIVLAESCTGGLVSAELAKVPGVSDWFCGSSVTYRNDTKIQWLGVDPSDIEEQTAVSEVVAEAMARGVLARTPEADLSASITGHFGPNAPHGFDGLVFVGIARRTETEITIDVVRHQLRTQSRRERQQEAAALVMATLAGQVDFA